MSSDFVFNDGGLLLVQLTLCNHQVLQMLYRVALIHGFELARSAVHTLVICA